MGEFDFLAALILAIIFVWKIINSFLFSHFNSFRRQKKLHDLFMSSIETLHELFMCSIESPYDRVMFSIESLKDFFML